MRPDEHKKKKNAQYKKKHGIKSTKDGNTAQKQDKEKDDIKTRSRLPKTPDARPLPRESTGAGSISEEHQSSSDVRKLPSNWDRYEIKDEEVTERRGDDYSLLLQSTSSAVSQFRFKAEQDWLDDPGFDPISIDFNRLADSLNCIPMHKRLGVDAKWFEEHQIREFEDDAESNKRRYEQKTEVKVKSEETAETYDPASSMVNSLLSESDSDLQLKNDVSWDLKHKDEFLKPQPRNDGALVCESATDSQETDQLLDELLSLSVDQPSIAPDGTSVLPTMDIPADECKPVLSVLSNHTSDDIEEGLDFLLSMDKPVKSTPSVISQTTAELKSVNEQSEDNLDEWLDSVLDD